MRNADYMRNIYGKRIENSILNLDAYIESILDQIEDGARNWESGIMLLIPDKYDKSYAKIRKELESRGFTLQSLAYNLHQGRHVIIKFEEPLFK